MDRHTRILNAFTGKPVDRTPVWFMRQAGRYMKEYREIRKTVGFLELCHNADLACEVTCQPVDAFDLDAAIVFSDILTIPEVMGREVIFEGGVGPKLPRPLRCAADVAELKKPDVADALPIVPETIKKFRAARPDYPILGFSGAPFTLFCYMVEGGGSKNWTETKKMLFTQPDLAREVLNHLADMVGDYLSLQLESGAAAVQMFDTWAGVLSPEDYAAFALPAAQRAFDRVKNGPAIYFTKDSSPFLHLLPQTGATAFGLDWRVDIGEARKVLGDFPVQGNMDPIALFAPPEEIARRVNRICDAAGPVGHVFNLGHGVIPSTPISGVQAMIDAVKARG